MAKTEYTVDWSKSVKGHLKQCRNAPDSASNLHKAAKKLALRYYGTEDISSLQPYQIDKIISWTTGIKPEKGKTAQRKAEKALHKKRTGSGKRYLNQGDKAQIDDIRKHRHKKNST